MGLLDPPSSDFRRQPLARFSAPRDLPGVVAEWDASLLDGSNDASVLTWADTSDNGHDLVPGGGTPVLKVAGIAGQNYVALGSAGWMRRSSFGLGPGLVAGGIPQPLVMTIVARAAATSPGANRVYVGGTGTGLSAQMALSSGAESPVAIATTTVGGGGKPLNDGQWHIVTVVLDTAYTSIWVDGYIVFTNTGQGHGTDALGSVALGANGIGGNPLNGDIAYAVITGRLTHGRITRLHTALAARFGITAAPTQFGQPSQYDTGAGGTALRLWEPHADALPTDGTPAPLVIWNHAYQQTQQISGGNVAYPLVQAWLNEGWRVVASNNAGDNWGNTAGLDAMVAGYTAMNARRPVSKVIMAGASMGGLLTALAIPDGRIPNIRGALTIDGVFDLSTMYSNGTYTASINTAYGVTDYASIPAGHNPVSISAASFGAVPWQFFAQTSDSAVPIGANSTAFQTKIAGQVSESTLTLHGSGHLAAAAFRPADTVAFIKRCLA